MFSRSNRRYSVNDPSILRRRQSALGSFESHKCVSGSKPVVTYTHTESMTIQPTSGGVAPLYKPRTPSFRTVCSVQSSGPRKWTSLVVCRRTLTVSNLIR